MMQQALISAAGSCRRMYEVEMRLRFECEVKIDVVLPKDLKEELLRRQRPFVVVGEFRGVSRGSQVLPILLLIELV